jgi:flavin reductase (DIM6/NTAB) family NADH-FMN oxidoreductase RutF
MQETDPHKRMAAAVGRIPSGLFIVTACQGDNTTGILASWVQQCSFEPLQISVAVQRNRAISAMLVDGAPFVVNILDSTQTDMIVHFGRGFAPGTPAFSGLETSASSIGPPILSESLAYLECAVVGRCPAGDHDLLIGRVTGGSIVGDGQPMVHVRKSGLHY